MRRERVQIDASLRPDGLYDGEKARENYRLALAAERVAVREALAVAVQPYLDREPREDDPEGEDLLRDVRERFADALRSAGALHYVYSCGFLTDELGLTLEAEEDFEADRAATFSASPEVTSVDFEGPNRERVVAHVDLFACPEFRVAYGEDGGR